MLRFSYYLPEVPFSFSSCACIKMMHHIRYNCLIFCADGVIQFAGV